MYNRKLTRFSFIAKAYLRRCQTFMVGNGSRVLVNYYLGTERKFNVRKTFNIRPESRGYICKNSSSQMFGRAQNSFCIIILFLLILILHCNVKSLQFALKIISLSRFLASFLSFFSIFCGCHIQRSNNMFQLYPQISVRCQSLFFQLLILHLEYKLGLNMFNWN